jgi:hypothetical protein
MSDIRQRGHSTIPEPVHEMLLESDKPEGTIDDGIPASIDDEEPQYEIPVSRSNQLDPERKAREFRARHIQMMALGIEFCNL